MAPKSVKGNGRVTAKPTATAKPKSKKKAAKKEPSSVPATGSSSVTYIRNLYSGAGGSRVDLNDTRIHLEPRGQRGDMRLVTEEMQMDPVYQHNLGVLFEEVPIAEGQDIIRKQAINQQAGPSTFDLLTNEYGAKYTQTRASVTAPFEQQGTVVASIDPGANGRNTTGNVDFNRTVQPQEFFPEAPTQQQSIFNPDVVPAGVSIEQAELFIQTPREERLALVESWIRQNAEAETYRNSLNVSVQPPRS